MKLFYIVPAIICAAALIALQPQANAQSSKRSKISSKPPNYYAILREYESKLKSEGENKESENERDNDHDDWKHIERWKWFWGPRVDAAGNFPNMAALMREWEKSGYDNAKLKMEGTKGTNALAQWKQLGPASIPENGGGMGRINCVRPSEKQLSTIWIGTACGGAWKSTDAGSTWSPMTDYLPALSVSDIAIHPNSVNTVYIATGDADPGTPFIHYSAGILRSDDAGKTWNPTGLSYRQDQQYSIRRLLVSPATPNLMLAATNAGIMLSSDAGATWNNVQDGNFRDLEYQPNNPLTVYAATANAIFKSTNAGKNWTQLSSSGVTGTANLKLAVSPANPAFLYAVGALGNGGFAGLWLSTDAGVSWKKQAASPNILGWSSVGSGANGQGAYDLALAVSRTAAGTIAIGGINIWRSSVGGTSLECAAHWYGENGKPYVHADIHDLIYSPDGKLYAGTDGGIFVSYDGGSSWTDLSKGLCISQFYRIGVGATNANITIGGAQDNGTSRFNGSKWQQVIGGDGMNCIVDYKNANISYGALYYGDIYKTTDNWVTNKPFINQNITQESGAWVTPYQLHPTNTSIAFAGYRNVWRTTSGGGSWEKISNFNQGSLTIIEIAESNPNYIYAGNSNGYKYTTDGGATWKNLTLSIGAGAVSAITADPKTPNRIWIAASGFSALKVLETTDFGVTWKNISIGLPSIPVNCLAYQKNSPDRMYAGTDIGVFYRDTLTKTWLAYSDGMPATIISDLKIHYGTGKLYAGTFGRGVWTGNLANCNTKIDLAITRTGNLTFCEGDSLTLTAQSGYSSYLWSNGASSRAIVIKSSGTYSATALTSGGCPATSQEFVVTAMPRSKPNISFSKPKSVLCSAGDSLQLSATIGFGTYKWNNGDTTRRIMARKPGKYFVSVTKPGNCDAVSDTVEVRTVTPAPAAITVNGNELTANPAGISYEWYLDGTKVSGANGRTFTPTSGFTKASVAITDSNGCKSLSEEFLLAVEENPIIDDELLVTPNPTSGDVIVAISRPMNGAVDVEILSVEGKIVRKERLTLNEEKLALSLNTSALASGVYYLRVSAGGRKWNQQIIKR